MSSKSSTMYSVSSILDHYINEYGRITFTVQWGDGSISKISDSDCNCEELIHSYLSNKDLTACSCEQTLVFVDDEDKQETKRQEGDQCRCGFIKTIYGFCRISSTSQLHGISLDAQEQAIRRKILDLIFEADDPKHVRVKIYRIVSTAWKKTSNVLLDLLEFSASGDIIMVYNTDRLSRDIFEMPKLLLDACKRGVLVYSCDENMWWTRKDYCRFIQGLLYAHCESLKISERIRSSLDYLKSKGNYIGSAPYGFKVVKNEQGIRTLVEDDGEKLIITEIKTRLGNGEDRLTIANDLNFRLLTKRGKQWNANMVKYIG